MSTFYELPFEQLKRMCNPDELGFETTNELEPLGDGTIAQERAVKALEFGLNIRTKGYNIYMSGINGSGKQLMHIVILKKLPKTRLRLMIGVMFIILQSHHSL